MTILLVQPGQYHRFYKNPHKLQALCWEAAPLLPGCDFRLWDRDTTQRPPESCFAMVLDATEAGIDDLRGAMDAVTARHVVLLDDLTGCGAPLEALYPQCSLHSVALSQAAGLLRALTGAAPTSNPAPAKLLLPAEVRGEYLARGIQYFTEGVARGCEGNCSFCRLSCRAEASGVRYVPYQAADLICQAENALPGSLFVQFSDENFFGLSKSRLERVHQLARQLRQHGFRGILGVDTRLDSIPQDSPEPGSLHALQLACWEEMIRAGLRYCFIGIESFSPSQARRYRKQHSHLRLDSALPFFREKGLTFTFGLILWDPLMTAAELQTNLTSIRDMDLLGKTASLLKPLRILPGSAYAQTYCRDLAPLPLPPGGTPDWDPVAAMYRDTRIRLMARLLFPIYGAFNDAGYRHSDVSLFAARFSDRTPDILRRIPGEVASLELSLIETLLAQPEDRLVRLRAADLATPCMETVTGLLEELLRLDPLPQELQVICRYYVRTFQTLLPGLRQLMN